MKKILISSMMLASLTACSPQDNQSDDVMAKANDIAQNTIIADLHVDVPYRLREDYEFVGDATERGDFDYPRAVVGGLNAPFMSIYTPAEHERLGMAKATADDLIDMIEALVDQAPTKFAIATSWSDVERHFEQGLISLPLGMENGAPIEGDLNNLDYFFERGIRYITLAHSESNHIADSSYDEERPAGGLTEFGRRAITRMNELGIMVDISHVSDEAFYEAIELSSAPVIASHSSARAFTPGFERNMDDDMIRTLGENGGVIFINYGSAFLTESANQYRGKMQAALESYMQANSISDTEAPEAVAFTAQYIVDVPYPFATLDDVLNHIDHVVAIAGIESVGIGSDYDGVGNTLPTDLKDVSSYPNLIAGLLQRGYSKDDIKKLLSGNLQRVWQAVEREASI